MSSEQNKRSGLSLDSYSLESGQATEEAPAHEQNVSRAALSSAATQATDAAGQPEAGTTPAPPIRIILRGQGFLIGASDPKITIGDVQLYDFEILSDHATIVGYLHEIPPEGSVIRIDYGRAGQAELPERFSLSKFTKDVT